MALEHMVALSRASIESRLIVAGMDGVMVDGASNTQGLLH